MDDELFEPPSDSDDDLPPLDVGTDDAPPLDDAPPPDGRLVFQRCAGGALRSVSVCARLPASGSAAALDTGVSIAMACVGASPAS